MAIVEPNFEKEYNAQFLSYNDSDSNNLNDFKMPKQVLVIKEDSPDGTLDARKMYENYIKERGITFTAEGFAAFEDALKIGLAIGKLNKEAEFKGSPAPTNIPFTNFSGFPTSQAYQQALIEGFKKDIDKNVNAIIGKYESPNKIKGFDVDNIWVDDFNGYDNIEWNTKINIDIIKNKY